MSYIILPKRNNKITRRNGSLPRPGPMTRQSNLPSHLLTSARTLSAMNFFSSSLNHQNTSDKYQNFYLIVFIQRKIIDSRSTWHCMILPKQDAQLTLGYSSLWQVQHLLCRKHEINLHPGRKGNGLLFPFARKRENKIPNINIEQNSLTRQPRKGVWTNNFQSWYSSKVGSTRVLTTSTNNSYLPWHTDKDC